ncbi:unnamed protein product, partial [Prorocentrum cordatum]
RPRRHTMLCERVARRTAPRGGRLGRARGVDAWRPGACRAKARVGQNWRNDALTGGDIRTLTCPTQPRAPAVLPPSGPRTVAAQERLGASAARAKPTKRTSRGVAGAGPRLAAAPGGAGAPRLRRRGVEGGRGGAGGGREEDDGENAEAAEMPRALAAHAERPRRAFAQAVA